MAKAMIGAADPLRNFKYQVEIMGGNVGASSAENVICGFSKVSGLKSSVNEILYREGNYKFGITDKKIAGQVKYEDVSFVRGFSRDGDSLILWQEAIAGIDSSGDPGSNGKYKTLDGFAVPSGDESSGNAQIRTQIKIIIFDKGEGDVEARRVTLLRAWPRSIEMSGLDARGNDVVLKSMVWAHEGIHWGRHVST